MKKLLILAFFLALYHSSTAQIRKIQHINAHHAEALSLFNLFKTTFRLPVVYDYQPYGSIVSGGLWMGNTTIEFVKSTVTNGPNAIFKGIAMEPVQHTDSIVAMLDANHIVHAAPLAAKFPVNGEEQTFWTNTILKNLTSADVRVFVCDYQHREIVSVPEQAGKAALGADKGGPLGIVSLKTIVIGVTDIDKASNEWKAIPGTKSLNDHQFQFADGPAVLLQKAEKDGIIEIRVQVHSMKRAATFLAKNQLLKQGDGPVAIEPAKVYGLRIVLEE